MVRSGRRWALRRRVGIAEGRATNINFRDHRILRINETREFLTAIVEIGWAA